MLDRPSGQQLVCTRCNARYPLDTPIWRCSCGGLLAILYAPRFDRRRITRLGPTLWRYKDAMPLARETEPVSLGEGYTPLLHGRLGGVPVFLKQDQLFPSGSFKDRGAAVLVSQVAALGIKRVVEDSSGNAGTALAAYCGRAGIACEIYAPEETSPAKLAQMRAYGADVRTVAGGRAAAAAAALEAAESHYYASHVWNPFFLHGTKSFALEIWEQMGWKAPDTVVLPAGNGTLLLGAALGFDELLAAGQIRKLPRLVAVQAEVCAPLADAFRRGVQQITSVTPGLTLAEGIAIGDPVRGAQMLAVIGRTGGEVLTVSEAEILQALRVWWRLGYALEPTAAATLAGLAQYVNQGHREKETIVSVITGHGLKAMSQIDALLGEGV